MARKASSKSNVIVPGGVDEYIEKCPIEAQDRLNDIRIAIQGAAPDSTETVSYFQMPGYFYEGDDYNGMFAWFSYKAPYVRLHLRPPVIEDHKKDIRGYAITKSIISFPTNKVIPKALVKKLVKASIQLMKRKSDSA